MIIKSISIKNFKSYYYNDNEDLKNENVFEFSEGLNIISGHNAAGKSNLFDAFLWVLFDRISGMKKDEMLSENNIKYINDKIKNERFISKSSKEIICSVKLVLIIPNENNREYEILKEKRISLRDDNNASFFHNDKIWKYENSELSVNWKDEKFNQEELFNENAKTELEKIFPKKISKYIWFQGEQLNELLDFDKKETLKKAIDYISYLSIYENMNIVIKETNRILGVKVKNKISANNRDTNKFKIFNSKLEKTEKELEDSIRKKSQKQEELDRLYEEEIEQREKLTILAGYPDLERRKGLYEGELKNLTNQVSNLYDSEKINFVSKWMLKGTNNLLEKAAKEISKFEKYRRSLVTENKKQLDEGIPGDELIYEMLDKEKCTICGRDAKKNSSEYTLIKSHLDKNKKITALDPEIEYLNDIIKNLRGKPSNILFKIRDIDNEISLHKKNISDKLFERNKKNKALDEVRTEIKELIREKGHEVLNLNPQNINSTIERIESDKKRISRLIDTFKDDIVKKKYDIQSINSQIRGLKIPGTEELSEEKLLKYTEFLSNVIEEQEKFEKVELIRKIEDTANKIQENIADINNIVIARVKLDENGNIDFVDADGNPTEGSGALKTLAKMSIINAIVKLSSQKRNENYPFIADAPTSEFAVEFTTRFFESISNTYNQSIIMTKDILSNIESYKSKSFVGKVFEISKNESKETALNTNSFTIVK